MMHTETPTKPNITHGHFHNGTKNVFSKLGCAFDIHDKTVIQVIYFTYYGTSEKKIILDNSKEFDNNLEIIIKTV